MKIRVPVILLAVLLVGCTVKRDKGIFRDSKHPVSKRFSILNEENGTVWLYLTSADQPNPEKAVAVFARSSLATTEEFHAYAEKGESPPLAKDYASKEAILSAAKSREFRFKWTADGQSVALVRNNSPIAMILAEAEHGFSKAVAKSGPYGDPWDQAAYERAFGK